MDLHARIELFGGPEDGREVTVPTGRDGGPVSPLPIPFPHPESGSGHEDAEQLVSWYERNEERRDGVWRYRYAVTQAVPLHGRG